MENLERKGECVFVCLENKKRSPVCAEKYRSMLEQRGYSVGKRFEEGTFDYVIYSAGLEIDELDSEKGIPFDEEMGKTAEWIFVMEGEMGEELSRRYKSLNMRHKIIPLGIGDIYYPFDHEQDRKNLEGDLERIMSEIGFIPSMKEALVS
jgi:predicted protein tyrosine phosphatase